MADSPIKSTGSMDFSGGVQSIKTATVSSDLNPNGLPTNALQKLVNGTMRSGGLSNRSGGVLRGTLVFSNPISNPYFQGETVYVPTNGTKPYKIAVIGGHVIQYDVDLIYPPIDLSAIFGLYHPVTARCWFEQAEQYLVIQAGDYNPETGAGTLPLFWNGQTLVRSNGLTGVLQVGTQTPNTYSLISASWGGAGSVPAIGDSFTATLTAASPQYGGNIGDLVTITVPATGTLGDVRVTGFTVNTVTFLNVSVPASPTPTLTTGSLVIELASAPNQAVTLAQAKLATVVENNLNIGVPPAGRTIKFTLSASWPSGTWGFYPGQVGDVINLWRNGENYGTFQVQSFQYFNSGSTITFLAVAPQNVGATIDGGAWTFQVLENVSIQSDYLVVPQVGGELWLAGVEIYPASSGTVYNGSVGDTVTLTDASGNVWGTFQVTTGNGPLGFQPGLGLQVISSNYIGQQLPQNMTIAVTNPASTTGVLISQIPAATAMLYYEGRLWYCLGPVVAAGDIVGSLSGTSANNYIDSVLSVTQNQLAFGGDGFKMPLNTGNITALSTPQMINASLGQGLLNISTLNAIFTLQVPVNEEAWSSATASNQPQINVVAFNNGVVSDLGWVGVNGDLWYHTLAPDIRSLITAVRYFQQWGGVSLSADESYILNAEQVNPALLLMQSGIYFNNRLLMATRPMQTLYGISHQAIIPLDLEPISTLEEQLPPVWEGHYEGLQVLQLTTAIFYGVQRAFALALSSVAPGQFEVWEFGVAGQKTDNGNRIQWQATLPSYTWVEHGWELDLKRLVSAELFLDNIQGIVQIQVEYSPDNSACWYPWLTFLVCSGPNPPNQPQPYPVVQVNPGQRSPLVLPCPPDDQNNNEDKRPANVAYQFALWITFKGACRLRGMFMKAEMVERELYEGMIEI